MGAAPSRTPGQRPVPGFYQFRDQARRAEARRYGYPHGVRLPGIPGEGKVRYEWEQQVVAEFERGASLNRQDWALLDGHARRVLREGPRCARDEETAAVLDRWDRPGMP